MDNTNFIDSEGHLIKTSSMKDQHQLIKITEKTPALQNIGKIVYGDTNSNILTFEIDRYYDGVDLLEKNIKFIVKNSYGVFTESAANLQYNDSLLRFSWVMSYMATTGGAVTAAIEFFGTTDSGENYSLKTTAFQIKPEESLDAADITLLPADNWIVDNDNRLHTLENYVYNGADFATNEDIANAISNIEYESDPIDFENNGPKNGK